MIVGLVTKLYYIFDIKLGLMCTILHNLLFSVFVEKVSCALILVNLTIQGTPVFGETRCCKSCTVIKLAESKIIVLLSKGYYKKHT